MPRLFGRLSIFQIFQVPVYFLNADFDYRNLLDFTAPDPDCLHTVISVMAMVVMMMLITMVIIMIVGTKMASYG